MPDIYETLWDADEHRLSVSARAGSGEWIDPGAAILLDTQVRAKGRRTVDLAKNRLFHRVDEARFAAPVYQTFIRLLDNYVVNSRDAEVETPEERAEIAAFLDAVVATRVAELARAYIGERLGQSLSRDEFWLLLRRIWFDLYTNHYGGRSVHHASGFEHVFVGEGKYDRRFGGNEKKGEISGYHSWVKFYLDESRERTNYLGYRYELRGGLTPRVPDVVTLQMIWNHADLQGRVVAQLFKRIGGFFVGPSPACEVVMGAVAFCESQRGLTPGERRRTTIHGQRYDLVIYRNVTPKGMRGDYIRSFYPVFLGIDDLNFPVVSSGPPATPPPIEPPIDRTVVIPVPPEGKNDGPVRIVAALPNPKGNDRKGEYVVLENATDEAIDLEGWELRDRKGRRQVLRGIIAAGATLEVAVARDRHNAFILPNEGGFISLHSPDELPGMVAGVNYGQAKEGVVMRFAVG